MVKVALVVSIIALAVCLLTALHGVSLMNAFPECPGDMRTSKRS